MSVSGTCGISRSFAEALIADDPELQKSIRGLEACLRVRASLGSGRENGDLAVVSPLPCQQAPGSCIEKCAARKTDSVVALFETSGAVHDGVVPRFVAGASCGQRRQGFCDLQVRSWRWYGD